MSTPSWLLKFIEMFCVLAWARIEVAERLTEEFLTRLGRNDGFQLLDNLYWLPGRMAWRSFRPHRDKTIKKYYEEGYEVWGIAV